MKAAARRVYGTFDQISIREVEVPTPKSNEILVKIKHTTVNRTDCAVVTGKPYIFRFFIGWPSPKKQILGTDFAGEVVGVGETANQYSIGDKVFGFNDLGISSQAEFMVINQDAAICKIPNGINYAQAAASCEAAHYALNFLNKVPIKRNQKILVNGATGGIGSALVQFLKAKGTYVTAVANTKNIELIKGLGVDKIYDYNKEDFTLDKEKYDYIFDAVGKSTFAKCKELLVPKGAYISSELGPWAQNIPLSIFTPLGRGKKVIFPMPTDIKGSLKEITMLLNKGKFLPIIEKAYPLDDIKSAYKYVNSGQKTGNVVIDIA